jgi:hypothetical protein
MKLDPISLVEQSRIFRPPRRDYAVGESGVVAKSDVDVRCRSAAKVPEGETIEAQINDPEEEICRKELLSVIAKEAWHGRLLGLGYIVVGSNDSVPQRLKPRFVGERLRHG